MDVLGVTESINVAVGRASDAMTSASTTAIVTSMDYLFLELLLLSSLFIFFSHEIWRKWRIKNETK